MFPLAVVSQITQSKTNPCLITLESGNNTQVCVFGVPALTGAPQIHIEVKAQAEANDFFGALLRRWKQQDVLESRTDSDKLGELDRKGSMNELTEREIDNALSEKVRKQVPVFVSLCILLYTLLKLWI